MNKILLLGTTALIAVGVVTSGVAQADEELITATIGGYFRSAIAVISQNDEDGQLADNNSSMAMANDIEIFFAGSTMLSNGISVGFNALLEGNAPLVEGATLDERYVFFQGSFGEIRIGQTDSARQEMWSLSPSGNYNFGVNSPFFIFGNPGQIFPFTPFSNIRTYDDALGNEDNINLSYFSPTFNGFRLGMSYAPNDSLSFTEGIAIFSPSQGAYGRNTTDDLGGLQNNAAFGAEFSDNFGDFNIRITAGYETYTLEICNFNAQGFAVVDSINITTPPSVFTLLRTANDQNCDNNPVSIQFGGTVNMGEWSIGGGYLKTEQIANTSNGTGRDRIDFDIGISWWSGAFGVGLMYGQAEVAEVDDGGVLTDEFKMYELNGTYVLGLGVDIGATIRRGYFDDATVGSGLDNEFTTLAVGTALSF